MYHKDGIKRLAISIIIQAIKDMHLEGKTKGEMFHKLTADNFFSDYLCTICTEIVGIKNIEDIYKFYKTKKLTVNKYFKKRKKHYRKGKLNE